jgi:hypothetical protein
MSELCAEVFLCCQARPLHRQLLDTLRALPSEHLRAFHLRLASCIAQRTASCLASGARPALAALQLAQPVPLLLSFPEHQPALQPCAAALLRCVALAVRECSAAAREGSGGAPPPPGDAVNELLAAACSLISHYGSGLTQGDAEGGAVVADLGLALLQALKVRGKHAPSVMRCGIAAADRGFSVDAVGRPQWMRWLDEP